MGCKVMWRVLTLVGMMMAGTAAAQVHKGYETPPYKVERADGAAEIRAYAPHILAEVRVQGDRSAAIGRGFRILAGYIFDGNEAKAKLAMTVPVAQSEQIEMTAPVAQSGAEDEWVVQFMMPSSYRLDTLPKPKDGNIRFVTTAPQRQVVLRFSEIATTAALEKRSAELRAWAAAQGITLGAGPHYYFYDAPMTLPWNRRNEVAFTVPGV